MAVLKYVLLFVLLGLTSANLMMSGLFVKNFGWKIYCSWSKSLPNETLDNVTIWRNDKEIVFFKPSLENNMTLTKNITTEESIININCEHDKLKQAGKCIILVDVKKNASDDVYKTLEFWGPPHWQRIRGEETVLERATKPILRQVQKPNERLVLNCSSEGIPAPMMVWTIGETKDPKEIPADFNRTTWNETTKLWQSWSVYKPTSDVHFSITCNTKQVARDGKVMLGWPSKLVNSAGRFHTANFLMVVLLIFVLLTNFNINM